jgi:hypothetical protein
VHLLQGTDFFVGFGMIAGHFNSGTDQKELQANIEVLKELKFDNRTE